MATLAQARSIGDSGPATCVRSVTPSDSADLPDGACRGFHVTAAGNVKFEDMSGNAVTVPVLASTTYPYCAKRIWSTGTTATGIFALY